MTLVGAGENWLDQLDIPAIPHFSDPTFNPYGYDGADEWFNGRRETGVPVQIVQTWKTETTDNGSVTVTGTLQQPEMALTEPVTEDSSQDDRSSEGVSYATAHATKATIPLLSASLNNPQLTAHNQIHKNSPLRMKAKLPAPLFVKPTGTHRVPVALSKPVGPPSRVVAPLPKPASPIGKNKMDRPVKHFVSSPVPSTDGGKRLHGLNMRHNEPDKHSGKRHSVAAARAGEYFIRTLRDYPEEGKSTAFWKK
ncbi:uncharacterized protein LOC129581063 [Paramacrobiotus metropolitanus]|uniref:uncharacterized protein LOC129581063 n=1 Tax=Paramacrobiotus metropolitanus TaxID=2943436 RepID=UPI00244570A2|nr:uncharacterized protein LOC129581063 [Paramacrobiotus metropolitanus]